MCCLGVSIILKNTKNFRCNLRTLSSRNLNRWTRIWGQICSIKAESFTNLKKHSGLNMLHKTKLKTFKTFFSMFKRHLWHNFERKIHPWNMFVDFRTPCKSTPPYNTAIFAESAVFIIYVLHLRQTVKYWLVFEHIVAECKILIHAKNIGRYSRKLFFNVFQKYRDFK